MFKAVKTLLVEEKAIGKRLVEMNRFANTPLHVDWWAKSSPSGVIRMTNKTLAGHEDKATI